MNYAGQPFILPLLQWPMRKWLSHMWEKSLACWGGNTHARSLAHCHSNCCCTGRAGYGAPDSHGLSGSMAQPVNVKMKKKENTSQMWLFQRRYGDRTKNYKVHFFFKRGALTLGWDVTSVLCTPKHWKLHCPSVSTGDKKKILCLDENSVAIYHSSTKGI